MTASVIHIVLLWVAVFAGLDIALGEGALTESAGEALERAVRNLHLLAHFEMDELARLLRAHFGHAAEDALDFPV